MHTKRIYIDSRYRLAGGTDSHFRYALKTPIEVPRGTMGWIDGVVISHSFNSVIKGHNDTLYVREVHGASYVDRALVITPGDYNGFTLATAIQALLNSGSTLPNVWSVSFDSGTLIFSNQTPAASGGGYIIPRSQVEDFTMTPAWGYSSSTTEPLSTAADACRLIGNLSTPIYAINAAGSFQTDFIDLLPYHILYLHSHIGAPTSQGPRGENTIVRRIVVTGTPGDLIVDHLSTQMDYIELGDSLSTLHFSLRDVEGRIVDTRGHSIAFSLCLA